jgi:hypothetical protein
MNTNVFGFKVHRHSTSRCEVVYTLPDFFEFSALSILGEHRLTSPHGKIRLALIAGGAQPATYHFRYPR